MKWNVKQFVVFVIVLVFATAVSGNESQSIKDQDSNPNVKGSSEREFHPVISDAGYYNFTILISSCMSKEECLIEAAKNGDTATVNQLLIEGVDVNAKDSDGKTALIHAAIEGQIDIVKVLLENGAYVNAKDNDGKTTLIHVVQRSNMIFRNSLVYFLKGSVRDYRNALQDHFIIVEILTAEGANVNAKEKYGFTALMLAAMEGHADMVKMLLSKGANVRARDNNGKTALKHAKEREYEHIVELLALF